MRQYSVWVVLIFTGGAGNDTINGSLRTEFQCDRRKRFDCQFICFLDIRASGLPRSRVFLMCFLPTIILTKIYIWKYNFILKENLTLDLHFGRLRNVSYC
jgi:hypothetical protein